MPHDDRITYHVVQSFQQLQDGWIADEPWSGPSADSVRAKAAALAGMRAYVVAFSRTGDAQLGDFEAPIILAEYGVPPPENDEFAAW